MSLGDALRFIREARASERVRDRLAAAGDGGAEELAAIGAELGFDFTPAEFDDAFRRDWAMRLVHYDPLRSHEVRMHLPESDRD